MYLFLNCSIKWNEIWVLKYVKYVILNRRVFDLFCCYVVSDIDIDFIYGDDFCFNKIY